MARDWDDPIEDEIALDRLRRNQRENPYSFDRLRACDFAPMTPEQAQAYDDAWVADREQVFANLSRQYVHPEDCCCSKCKPVEAVDRAPDLLEEDYWEAKRSLEMEPMGPDHEID